MKTLHTDETVIMNIIGPSLNKEKVLKMLTSLGFKEIADSIPWREVLSEYSDKQLPGVCLSGARGKEGLTQLELSKKTGIPQRHISEMENGKRPIGKKNAKVFAKVLRVVYRIFL